MNNPYIFSQQQILNTKLGSDVWCVYLFFNSGSVLTLCNPLVVSVVQRWKWGISIKNCQDDGGARQETKQKSCI